jgi:cell division GTPase FtsZ
MSGEIDLSAFERDDHAGEWDVLVSITATVRETVTAETAEEARRKVQAQLDANEIEVFGEDFDDARIETVRAHPVMYWVFRDGQPMRVSHVQPRDLPRKREEVGND